MLWQILWVWFVNNREPQEISRSSIKRNVTEVTEISYYHLSIVNFSYKFNTSKKTLVLRQWESITG